jgi:hypothetical protein
MASQNPYLLVPGGKCSATPVELSWTHCRGRPEAKVSNGPGNQRGYRETEVPLHAKLD